MCVFVFHLYEKKIVLFFRDISFLYDATVPDKRVLDSAGKQLVMSGPDGIKMSPGDKYLERAEKSRESEKDAMVKFWRIFMTAHYQE